MTTRLHWLGLVALAACALTSKSKPLDIRYFSPEARLATDAPLATAPLGRLRLGRISPSAILRYRIVHRASDVELETYETLRWTEYPDAYVRRSLARALFDDRRLEQVVGGAAATLEIEVLAFEEVRRGEHRAGRVQLRYLLHDDRRVLASDTVTAEREAAGPEIDQVVPAIGAALEAVSSELAARVTARLGPET